MPSDDVRCPHCHVIILLKERAAEGIPLPQHCPMCGERVEAAHASKNVPSSTQRRDPARP